MTYADVLCPDHDFTGCPTPKTVGSRVRLGRNAGPEFEVVHIEGGMAWVRGQSQHLVPVDRLHVT